MIEIKNNNNSLERKNNFPLESAGSLMTTDVPSVLGDASISDVEKILLRNIKNLETLNYIYVVDKHRRLKGVISIKDLFRLPKDTIVSKVMFREIVTVRVHTDQELVALKAIKHNLKAIPVIDKDDYFLGVVPSDTILNILHNENIEDSLRLAGVNKFEKPLNNLMGAPVFFLYRKRFSWLAFGLFGGIAAAFVVGRFEAALEAQIILAAFIPTIVYLSDALGAQTEAILIRSLAINRKINFIKYLWREVRVGLLLSISLGLLMLVLSFAWKKLIFLSIILGLSVFSTAITATLIATSFPFLLSRLKFDPAFAAGPLGTIMRDILSILIYFSIAQAMLSVL